MEFISNFIGEDLKEKPFFPEDTYPDEGEEVFEAGEEDGGKILKGREGLVYELDKQVEIFHSGKYQEARTSAGNEFPQDSGWEMPIENEGRIFGGNIKYTDTLVKILDFGIDILSGNSSMVSKLRLIRNEISNSKLKMAEEINKGRQWTDYLTLGTRVTISCGMAYMANILEKDFIDRKMKDEKGGLVHGGMEFSKILPLRYFKIINRDNSGVDLGLLPEFVKQNSLKKRKV